MRRSASVPALPCPCASRSPAAAAGALLVLAVLALPAPAEAARKGGSEAGPATESRRATAVRRYRSARPVVQRTSSDETAAERDRRLARECRGLPNAGACLGYAR